MCLKVNIKVTVKTELHKLILIPETVVHTTTTWLRFVNAQVVRFTWFLTITILGELPLKNSSGNWAVVSVCNDDVISRVGSWYNRDMCFYHRAVQWTSVLINYAGLYVLSKIICTLLPESVLMAAESITHQGRLTHRYVSTLGYIQFSGNGLCIIGTRNEIQTCSNEFWKCSQQNIFAAVC